MHTLLCVCPPRVESLFPPVLSKSCNQIPLDFKIWFSRNSSSPGQTPRLGSLTWGSEPSLQWVDFCDISVLQSVSHPPSNYGIWFYCDCAPPTVSLWLLLCLCMWGISFGEFQCPPVDDCPAASCDSGVLTRGSESTSFYPAIFVPILPMSSASWVVWSKVAHLWTVKLVLHNPSCWRGAQRKLLNWSIVDLKYWVSFMCIIDDSNI